MRPRLTLFVLVESSLSACMTTFSEQPLGDLIIRLALVDSSQASMAVLHAMMALTCLSKYGPGIQADQFKLFATRALLASSNDGISTDTAPQHVAAGMLLSHYEVRVASRPRPYIQPARPNVDPCRLSYVGRQPSQQNIEPVAMVRMWR